MTTGKKGSAAADLHDAARADIETAAAQIIKDYLLPMQTKKLSKKMIEQIATQCAGQIAEQAVAVSRKASGQQAARLTKEFSQILSDQNLRSTPIFNDKLTAFTGQLSPEAIEKIKADRETAARVVSRVYKSIFDFARDIGIKTADPVVADSKATKKK